MRIVASATAARPSALDRNAIQRIGGYTATSVAPHAATTRASYTCPVGKKVQVMSALISVVRDLAAGAVGYVVSSIQFLPGGINGTPIVVASMYANGVGSAAYQNVGQGTLMIPSDVISVVTSDLSTGGTCWHTGWYTASEYDA